jgi:ABC-2 type transport system permease protein
MFLHNFIYELKTAIRTKDLVIWLIVFPIALGAFFKVAFHGLYEKETLFSTVDVAVVDEADDSSFRAVADNITSGDEPLLNVSYADREKAMELLKNGDVSGVIFTGNELSLSVTGNGLDEEILKTFVEQYNFRSRIIGKSAECGGAEAAQKAAEALTREVTSVERIPLTDGNTNNLIQYFYNLLGMVAMFGSTTGLHITKVNQANISALGARKCCSPTPKSVSLAASLTASYLIQTVCMLLSVSFIAFILRVDLGSSLSVVYFTSVLAGTVGVSLGFFLGSIGALSEKAKESISVSVSLLLCFCSGLMIANMRTVFDRKLPWFNRINPAAVISDSYYALNIYSGDNSRYFRNIITMAVITVAFALLGFALTRRKKYASL